jgi:DNA-binding FadR family transcriptional regulator
LAAERARSTDIQQLDDSIAALSQPGLSPSDYARIDVAFHARLAAAARNALFVILSETINAVMLDRIESEFRENPEAQEDSIREHTAILKCVRAGDVHGARKAMADSLSKAPDHWRTYSRQEPPLLKKIESDKVKRSGKSHPSPSPVA